jgi:hypothetical protein
VVSLSLQLHDAEGDEIEYLAIHITHGSTFFCCEDGFGKCSVSSFVQSITYIVLPQFCIPCGGSCANDHGEKVVVDRGSFSFMYW